MIENVSYVMEKNQVLDYLDNIVRVKVDRTERCSGNYHKCINGSMTSEEYSRLCNADSWSFEKIVCSDYKVFCVRDSFLDDEMLDYIKADGFFT